MSDPVEYTIQLMAPNGELLGKRTLRIWPDDLLSVEYQAHKYGMELARDAIHREGYWDAFRHEQLKSRTRETAGS